MTEIKEQNIANYSNLVTDQTASTIPNLTELTDAVDLSQSIQPSTIQVNSAIENLAKAQKQELPEIDRTTEQLSFTNEAVKLRDCMVLVLYSPSSNENPNLSNSPLRTNQVIGEGVSEVSSSVGGIVDSLTPEDSKNFIGGLKDNVNKSLNEKDFTSGQIEELNNSFYNEGSGTNKKKTIFLPLPKQIFDLHNHNIDAFSNNPIVPIAGIVSTALNAITGSAGTGGGTRKYSVPGLGDYIANNLQLGLRKTFNPAVETLYRSPTPRNWQWNIEYSPTSKEDADNFIKIIEELKQHSYPTQDVGGILYTFPGTVDFYFRINEQESKVLPRSVHKCFIKGVQIDYTQQGFYAHFKDGNPVTIVLTLDIAETRLISRSDLDPRLELPLLRDIAEAEGGIPKPTQSEIEELREQARQQGGLP